MKYNKNEKVLAKNKRTGETKVFSIPMNNMCVKMLTRYCIIRLNLGEATDTFIFIKQ